MFGEALNFFLKKQDKKKDSTILIEQGSLVAIGKSSESHLLGLNPSSVLSYDLGESY